MKSVNQHKKFNKNYNELMKMITGKFQDSQDTCDVDEQLNMLWNLGNVGDMNALCLYALAILMEGKGWYNLKEGRIVLAECAEQGNAMSQYFLALINFEGREGWEQDVITRNYWMNKAASQGYQDAISFLNERKN